MKQCWFGHEAVLESAAPVKSAKSTESADGESRQTG